MHGVGAVAPVGAVDHVVVDEGGGVQHLQGGAGVDDRRGVGIAAGAHERPVAERRPQALPATQDGRTQRRQRRPEVRVDRRPPFDLRREQLIEAAIDPGATVASDSGRARARPVVHVWPLSARRLAGRGGNRSPGVPAVDAAGQRPRQQIGDGEQEEAGDHVCEVVVGGHDDAEDGGRRIEQHQDLAPERPDQGEQHAIAHQADQVVCRLGMAAY